MSAKENADYLMDAAMKAGITDPKELANFMGQMQVECGGYASMNEGLGYSGSRLLEVFPGRNGMDTLGKANAIAAGGPESIANEIYGGAWGKKNLGNTQPGDGWNFHGRGFVQLTGRDNYERVGKELGIDLAHHPELAADRDVAAKIAIHYWKDRVQANGHQNDVTGACKDINGGHNGLDARKAAAQAWESALDKGYKPGGPDAMPMAGASHGMSKQKTEQVQTLLNTHGYVDSNGKPLVVDGHAGKETPGDRTLPDRSPAEAGRHRRARNAQGAPAGAPAGQVDDRTHGDASCICSGGARCFAREGRAEPWRQRRRSRGTSDAASRSGLYRVKRSACRCRWGLRRTDQRRLAVVPARTRP